LPELSDEKRVIVGPAGFDLSCHRPTWKDSRIISVVVYNDNHKDYAKLRRQLIGNQ